MQNEKVPATQADREAAWPYRPTCYKDDPETKAFWMHGTYDKAGGVPIAAFAAHRVASTTAQSEAVQKLVDALGESREALFQFKAHNAWRMTAGENDVVSNAISNADRALAAHRESQP